MKELVECYKEAQDKQGYVPRFRPSPPSERSLPRESQPKPPLPEKSQPVPSTASASTVSLEDIKKLYGQAASAHTAPKTPQGTHAVVVDLCSPDKQDSTGKLTPEVRKDGAWRYQNDLSAGVMIRFHPGGRQEQGRMSTPKGAAWQIATFENGDSIDANSCLGDTVLLYFLCDCRCKR